MHTRCSAQIVNTVCPLWAPLRTRAPTPPPPLQGAHYGEGANNDARSPSLIHARAARQQSGQQTIKQTERMERGGPLPPRHGTNREARMIIHLRDRQLSTSQAGPQAAARRRVNTAAIMDHAFCHCQLLAFAAPSPQPLHSIGGLFEVGRP